MRQILFRGFHKCENGGVVIKVDGKEKRGEWVEGYYCAKGYGCADFDCIEPKDDDEAFKYLNWKVIPSTVRQFTGYPKAFENDIVKHQDKHGHTVYGIIKFGEYDDNGRIHIGFYVEWQNDGMNTWDDWLRHDLKYWFERSTEIIGNVFENSDLIGDGENA